MQGDSPPDVDESNKIRKISNDQSASSMSSSRRYRRAARACEQCRSSKLRCQAPDPSTGENRCAHCAKMNLACHYTVAAPPTSTPMPDIFAPDITPRRQDETVRLSKLESNVAKLLEMMEKRSSSGTERGSSQLLQQTIPQDQLQDVYRASPRTRLQQQDMDTQFERQVQTSSLNALADFAVSNGSALSSSAEFNAGWLSNTSNMPVGSSSGLSRLPVSNFGSSTNLASSQSLTSPNTMHYPSHPTTLNNLIDFPTAVFSGSPNGASDTGHSQHSGPSLGDTHSHPSHKDNYAPSQARPIPQVAAASRMAAFTEPTSHEAPFRSLTYNPDTFRNSELSRDGSEEPQQSTVGESGIAGSQGGRKTPKRGGGDPIDRGIFAEDNARALFDFFHHEIHFFLPVLQEPITFDFVRHRSSFLLSTILAIASKYCCETNLPFTKGEHSSGPFAFNLTPTAGGLKHGVQPVAEDSWLQIRSLAMSSYFQALISKVHCLEDVQATLFLCAWGLQDRGASPDPWLLTGSGYRLSRRLGIHLACATLASASKQPTAKLIASYKTYLCLYAFDRFLTVGFGRPETEGFEPSTIDTSLLHTYLEFSNVGKSIGLELFLAPESAACIAAYVELASIARDYSRFVNITLKEHPSSCVMEMETISGHLDSFSNRWLRARSALALKLGLSARPVRMLYHHIRLCLHSVPLKPMAHPGSQIFLRDTGLEGQAGVDFLLRCLKKTEDFATAVIQAFVDDVRDDNDAILCYAYDYACMVLVHSAAVLLRLATTRVCGIGPSEPSSYEVEAPSKARRDVGMDLVTAMRYCGMAITGLVESNRSANGFPCDMAGNLSLIAKETGMVISDWTSEKVVQILAERSAPPELSHGILPSSDGTNTLPLAFDFTLFSDFDMSLQPSFFENDNFF